MLRRGAFLLALPVLLASAAYTRASPALAPEPRTATPAGTRSILDYTPRDTSDWSGAIQRAASENREVYFPGGRSYRVKRSVTLSSPVTLRGDGARSLVVQDTSGLRRNFDVFVVRRAGVTVRDLGFRGMGRTTNVVGFAVKILSVGGVTVDRIRVDSLGMVLTDHAEPGTVIRNSVGDGGTLFPWNARRGVNHGILLVHSRGVEVVNDTLSDYGNGIQWWGIHDDRAGRRHLLTMDHRIHRNTVLRSGAAIWGTGGVNIRVEGNTAVVCHDVCFDAENSRRVWFVNNVGKYAGTAVLAAFYRADSIFFERNRAYQSNRNCFSLSRTQCWPNHRLARDPRLGQRLFSTLSGSDTTYRATHVFSRGNRLEHEDGVGFVDKTASSTFVMQGDTLVNTVIHLEGAWNGRISLLGLLVTITRPTPHAAIKVATHEHQALRGIATRVEGNRVERTVRSPAGTPGIDVFLRSRLPLRSVVASNQVRGYDEMAVAAHGDGARHEFAISRNTLSGRVAVWGSPAPAQTTQER